jgi:hypothetical protein
MAILKILEESHYSFLTKGWYLSYYYTTHGGNQDIVSRNLLHFKDGIEPYTNQWIKIVSSCFTGKFQPDIILRVLASEEIQCGNSTSLDKLGREISKKVNKPYLNSSLYKTRATKPLKYLKKDERFAEINGVYRFKKPDRQIQSILLLDDIVTSGTTIVEIKRAIKSEIGDFNLYLFVLGKTFDSWRDVNADNCELQKLFETLPVNISKEEAWS